MSQFAIIPSRYLEMDIDHAQIALLCAMSVYTKIDGTVLLTPAHLALKMKKTTKWVNQKIILLEHSGLIKTDGGKIVILYSLPQTPSLHQSSNSNLTTVDSLSNSTNLNAHSNKRAKEKGTPIPEDFKVTKKMQNWAKEKAFSINILIETEKFTNHAEATDRSQSRWEAAWRNWMLQAEQYADERSKPNGSGNKKPEPIDIANSIRAAKERITRDPHT